MTVARLAPGAASERVRGARALGLGVGPETAGLGIGPNATGLGVGSETPGLGVGSGAVIS
jgi:hypothetical protein